MIKNFYLVVALALEIATATPTYAQESQVLTQCQVDRKKLEIAIKEGDRGKINSIVTEKVLPYIEKIREALKDNLGRRVTHSKVPYIERYSLDFRPPAGYMDQFTFGDIGNFIRSTEGKYPSMTLDIDKLGRLGHDSGSDGIRILGGDHLYFKHYGTPQIFRESTYDRMSTHAELAAKANEALCNALTLKLDELTRSK